MSATLWVKSNESWNIQVFSAETNKNFISLIMCSALPMCLCLYELAMTISIPDLCSWGWCPLFGSSCSTNFQNSSLDSLSVCLKGLWKLASSKIIVVICPLIDWRISSALMKCRVSSLGSGVRWHLKVSNSTHTNM